MQLELTSPTAERPIRRRNRRDPRPRFKADVSGQLDVVQGCPALQVNEEHLARTVSRVVERFDLSAIEATYSSLGRHGYAPRNLLAVWIYASLIGLHHATKVARALQTDAALRLLSGGHKISRSKLNEFRTQRSALFENLIAQTVAMASVDGILPLQDLAADSMRLRAHASTKAVRTLVRSEKRLIELAIVDQAALSGTEREQHLAKVGKHQHAVSECRQRDRRSIVTTNPFAALMKFPDGAGLPGHRISAMAAGVKERIVVGVLVSDDTNDYGLLEPIVDEARRTLAQAGLDHDAPLQIAADAGYCAHADLAYAERVRPGTDILVNVTTDAVEDRKFFGRDRFVIHPDASATCPAGRLMKGPTRHIDNRTMWLGVGCSSCSLHAQCTKGKRRTLTANLELDRLRAAMNARVGSPEGKQRYNRRIATVEPVFSSIESAMGYRRASSRNESTIVAEVLLKVLAHNVSRIAAAAALRRVYFELTPDGALRPLGTEFPATL